MSLVRHPSATESRCGFRNHFMTQLSCSIFRSDLTTQARRPSSWVVHLVWTLLICSTASAAEEPSLLSFVFTSDVHFGIARGSFRGEGNVDAKVVNAAMVRSINALPGALLPNDHGLKAGQKVGPIEFVAITGDIASRQELYPVHIQSAASSWKQFDAVYLRGLTLKDHQGQPAQLLVVPGNHDVSNAIGSPTKMVPATDATSLAEMYNLMMHPALRRTKDTYNYATDKIFYARDVGGVHFVFLTMWPDSAARAWMEQDLRTVAATTPVFLFCHDQPDLDTKHLTNPNGKHDVNETDKFENVVSDPCADGLTTDAPSTIEQRALVAFLKRHKNIVAYFHGHSNWTEYYTWKGPDEDIALKVFRADSPMKGKTGQKDETKLAYELVVFSPSTQMMTVRECFWNGKKAENPASAPVDWGISTTVSIAPPH
jgi:hypothetical protein